MAIKIGITGGIGSGKSVVSHLLEVMGVPVYISDIESKRLTVTDPKIRNALTSLLGKDVYQNGELNKPVLANYLFAHTNNALKINSIIHPRVKEDFQQWVIRHANYDIIALESAILIEAGFSNEVDHIVMVYAPEEIRVERAMKRDSSSREQILKRISTQMSDEEKKQKAEYVISNDGTVPLIPQILSLLSQLRM